MSISAIYRAGYKLSLLLLLLACLCSPASVSAQNPAPGAAPGGTAVAAPQPKSVFLLIPFNFSGDFIPITSDELKTVFEPAVEQAAPGVDLIIADAQDPLLQNFKPGTAFSQDAALALAKAYNADFICWGGLSFTHSKIVTLASAGSPVYQYILTVKGIADVKVFDVNAGDIAVEEVMAQSNNGTTRAFEDSLPYQTMEKNLAQQCVADLAGKLVQSLKTRLQP